MNIKLDKKSEALLKEMLRKNSRYGSVDIIVNEAFAMSMFQKRRKGSGNAILKAWISPNDFIDV